MKEPLRYRSIVKAEAEFRVLPIGRCDVCKEPAYFGHSSCNIIDGEEVWAGGTFCRKHSDEFTRKMFPALQAEGGPHD